MRFTAFFLLAIVALAACNSPADQVLQRIGNLSRAASNEQAQQTKIYASQSQRCKVERAFRNKEISDANIAKGAADQQLSLCKTELPIAKAAHSRSKAELKISQTQLAQVNNEKQIFDSVNYARQQEHEEVLAAIQGAYQIIAQFQNGQDALDNGAFFVQVTEKVNKIFRTAVKHGLHRHMVPVMQQLVQLTKKPATQVSSEALSQVVQQFQQLENKVKASEAARSQTYVAYLAKYSQQEKLLNQQIVQLTQIIKTFKQYIANLNVCVNTETAVSKEAQAKLTRNSNILTATVKLCNSYDAKFKQQSKERQNYIKLLSQLKAFVASQINSFKSGLYSRKDYVNQF